MRSDRDGVTLINAEPRSLRREEYPTQEQGRHRPRFQRDETVERESGEAGLAHSGWLFCGGLLFFLQ